MSSLDWAGAAHALAKAAEVLERAETRATTADEFERIADTWRSLADTAAAHGYGLPSLRPGGAVSAGSTATLSAGESVDPVTTTSGGPVAVTFEVSGDGMMSRMLLEKLREQIHVHGGANRLNVEFRDGNRSDDDDGLSGVREPVAV